MKSGLIAVRGAMAINLALAFVKITTGVIGNSHALVADGIESTTDVFTSLIVWSGLRLSAKPPDLNHPYGHGKAESLAGLIVSVFLIGAAILISIQSVREILTPHQTPKWYTLLVLALVVIIKESLYRFIVQIGDSLESSALKGDAWHHRSDALTSLAAFLGIGIALVGGPGYEVADDWAALLACGIIVYSGVRLMRPALDEVLDAAAPDDVEARVRSVANGVKGVVAVEKCRIRKSGVSYLADIHVVVDGNMSVRDSHQIAHVVKDHLLQSPLSISDAIIHIEPADQFEL
ncbi:MAG: cation transporter [candidate division Zixibacteria bacterium]|nr:cation transporter [candidate division Zixibacteria bacterium]